MSSEGNDLRRRLLIKKVHKIGGLIVIVIADDIAKELQLTDASRFEEQAIPGGVLLRRLKDDAAPASASISKS